MNLAPDNLDRKAAMRALPDSACGLPHSCNTQLRIPNPKSAIENPYASSSRFLHAHSALNREQSKMKRIGMSQRGRICGTEFGRST